ncbi:MAG: hypothetical protein JXA96_00350 [Sedimentisphaerales bacterium]|nr:hypothetical protein [Sedimentisphaerales bacterium]
MTPEQIILLLETSAKQYTSIEAKINVTGYITENEEEILHGVYEITTRWSHDKEYWNIYRTIYPTSNFPHTREEVITYAFTDQQTKKLTQEHGKTPRGLVRLGGKRKADQSFLTINMALWEYCDVLWKRIHDLHDIAVKYDRFHNLYELKVKVQNPIDAAYIFYLDPTKKFIPVKKEIIENESLVKHIKCSQFQNVNNVWIPYLYSCTEFRERRMQNYEVEEVSANIYIEERLFDFDFPPDTIIIDEIADIKQKFKMQ